jgi:hypothetical protein
MRDESAADGYHDDASHIDLLKFDVSTHLDLYKHHFDLFLKVIAIYLAAMSAIVVYLFRPDIAPSLRRLLPLLIVAGSAVAAAGCAGSLLWLKQLEQQLAALSQQLGISQFVLVGPRRLILILLLTTIGFVGVGLVLLIWSKILLPT